MELHISDLPTTEDAILAAARIATAAFAHIPYLDKPEDAVAEVREALEPGKICLAAWDATGTMVGWIGGFHAYAQVWELHPLAVDPARQRSGAGRALTLAFEARAAAVGAMTVTLGTDDEFGATNLFGAELYPDVLAAARRLESTGGHPFAFYLKLGYAVTGLIPDANGFGKPDILMCKRVGRPPLQATL